MEDCLHYDLDFLSAGKIWPPEKDKHRYEGYDFARREFELTADDWVKDVIPSGLLDLQDYSTFVEHVRLLAYPRLLTLKTIDMILGQPPIIAAKADDAITTAINETRSACHLNSVLKQALIDYSRFGVFLIRVFKEGDHARLTAWDPREWVPVFHADGTKRIRFNVIGWVYEDKLTVQIHEAATGKYEERVYKCFEGLIGEMISAVTYNETLKKPLFYAVANTPTTTNPLGTGDYAIINAPLRKALERLKAILKVLDEHASPSMTGPYSLLRKKTDGESEFVTSKYYALGENEREPKYIVWQAQLDSSFKAFSELMSQIYILSEMGEAFLGASGGASNVVSGTAMRFKMISPLEKARRVSNEITEPLKQIVSTLMAIEGKTVATEAISISWRDSLPKDPRETAELTRMEAGAPAVKPLNHALMDNYDLDDATAKHYVDGIVNYAKLFDSIDASMYTEDGRSHGPTSSVDIRKRGSSMDPATSENRSEDLDAGTQNV